MTEEAPKPKKLPAELVISCESCGKMLWKSVHTRVASVKAKDVSEAAWLTYWRLKHAPIDNGRPDMNRDVECSDCDRTFDILPENKPQADGGKLATRETTRPRVDVVGRVTGAGRQLRLVGHALDVGELEVLVNGELATVLGRGPTFAIVSLRAVEFSTVDLQPGSNVSVEARNQFGLLSPLRRKVHQGRGRADLED